MHTHTHTQCCQYGTRYIFKNSQGSITLVSRVTIGNKRTSSRYKATIITYAKLYKSAIFPKHILQYGSGNAETGQGFGKHGMSRAILRAGGIQLTPLVIIIAILLLFISRCGFSTTKRKEESYTTQAVTMVLGLKPC